MQLPSSILAEVGLRDVGAFRLIHRGIGDYNVTCVFSKQMLDPFRGSLQHAGSLVVGIGGDEWYQRYFRLVIKLESWKLRVGTT